MEINNVGANYGSSIVFLFFGGFVLALGLEKVNLHKRIALTIIKKTGTSPNKVVLGFMIATAFMSMWISNTSSTVVMLPIALSVINLLINQQENTSKQTKNFALSVMLGIAFSCSSSMQNHICLSFPCLSFFTRSHTFAFILPQGTFTS